jgi:predicted ArsR family transcriptional regulator
MDMKKDLLLRSAARLYSLGIEVESARQHLRELVEQGVAYTSPEMRKALEDYQELDRQWKELEQEFLRLKNDIKC